MPLNRGEAAWLASRTIGAGRNSYETLSHVGQSFACPRPEISLETRRVGDRRSHSAVHDADAHPFLEVEATPNVGSAKVDRDWLIRDRETFNPQPFVAPKPGAGGSTLNSLS